MVRYRLITASFLILSGSASAMNIWLSPSDSLMSSPPPPATPSEVPVIYHFASQTSGSIFLWARPDSGKTLENWSLRLTSTSADLLGFTGSHIEDYNAKTNGNFRWEYVHEPAGVQSEIDASGFSVDHSLRIGEGIGTTCMANDPYCDADGPGWLLGKFDYSLGGSIGQTSLFLQIGELAINNQGEFSSQISVVFGHVTDGALNGEADRLQSSSVADATISMLPEPDADFDLDGEVDGIDFLTWQRGHGTGTMHAQGDATGDGVVDVIDLAAWQYQFGSSGAGILGNPAVAAPEPTTLAMVVGMLLALGCRAMRLSSRMTPRHRCIELFRAHPSSGPDEWKPSHG